MFVLHFIGHLIKPNSIRKPQDNMEKCGIELMNMSKTFSKTTTSYLRRVGKNKCYSNSIISNQCY